MVYIKRDKDGRICAVYSQKTSDVTEQIDINDAEFVDFCCVVRATKIKISAIRFAIDSCA